MKYTKAAQAAIDNASKLSKKMHHNYVGTEHLLLALLKDEESLAAKVLAANNINADALMSLISELIAPAGGVSLLDRFGHTPKLVQILEQAENDAAHCGVEAVGTEHLLLAIIRIPDCAGARLINSLNVSPNKIFADITAGMGREGIAYREQMASHGHGGNEQSSLEQFSKDLTQMAADGLLDPIIGRKDEIKRVIQILSRRGKNNPCLIGEPGVGKTAIVEGLAQAIASGAVPASVQGMRLLSLDLSGMVAGTKYRGEFEARIKKVMSEVIAEGNIILFIDELHTIIGAGGAEGALDAANILKPALSRGELQIIGATTIDEYRKHIEKDAALERRFLSVMVEAPTTEQTKEILHGVKHLYEAHHEVTISDEAIDACVELSDRYITDRSLPDKAIDLLDEASAAKRLSLVGASDKAYQIELEIKELTEQLEDAITEGDLALAAAVKADRDDAVKRLEKVKKANAKKAGKTAIILTEEDVASVVSLWTRIPVSKLSEKEATRLRNLEKTLHKRIIGQEDAVSAVARAVRRGRVGLKEKGRPIGSFLFLGPTGVGKTEISKALAEAVFGKEDAMIRVDMTEYMEKHSVSKLVGSPPGYVGFDEGGQLSEKVRCNPYSVLLFDEIEKAHPDVFNILLQVLDDGHITDSQGRKVDFKNTIIIMTSNAGASAIVDPKKLGFASKEDEKNDYEYMKNGVMEEVKRIFKPEFLNRIDDTIVFRQLNKSDMTEIVTLLTNQFAARCKEQMNIMVKVSVNAKKQIVEEAFDPKFGARPLKRKIQTTLEDPMSEKILAGEIKSGDTVEVKVKDKKIIFV